jgi:hypothetical protein
MLARTAATLLICVFATLGALSTPVGGLTATLLAVLGVVALLIAWPRRSGTGAGDAITAVTLPPPARPVAELSTDDLCTGWRRSYFQLLVARDTADRPRLVQRRQDYLDEIERRDPGGFRRWLAGDARAGGDPRPYLTIGR